MFCFDVKRRKVFCRLICFTSKGQTFFLNRKSKSLNGKKFAICFFYCIIKATHIGLLRQPQNSKGITASVRGCKTVRFNLLKRLRELNSSRSARQFTHLFNAG